MKAKRKTIKNVSDERGINEKSIILRISLVSVLGNATLSIFKFVAGIIGGSSAMVSDAIHSFSDVLTTIIAVFGVRLSKKEADKSHPYGHERFECVASLILGIILLVTGIGIGKAGIENIASGNYKTMATPGIIALIAAIISIITKEGMYWYTRYYAKIIKSPAFMADAWHHRSDALSSIGSLIGVVGAMLGLPIMDCIASLVICLFIFKVSYDILKDAISKMLDTSCGEKFEKELTEYVAQLEEIVQIDKIHSRRFGNKAYIDMVLRIDGELSLREADNIAERIHNKVENHFSDIKHISIQLKPLDKETPELIEGEM